MDRMNIVYATDDNYAMITGISMISLFENNRQCDDLDIYILSDNISDLNKKKLYGIGQRYQRKVQIIDVIESLLNFQQRGASGYANENGSGYSSYAKLLIPDILCEIERIIYLDSDTLVLGDISCLMNLSMHGKPIGMAHDCLQSRYKRFINLTEGTGYYNSGMLIYDMATWKERKCSERIIEHIIKVRNVYPLPDQDLINVVLHDDIYKIDAKYNYLSQYYLYSYSNIKKVYELKNISEFYTEDRFPNSDEAVILHFCGQTFIRPWYRNSKHPAKQIYDKYYNLSPWRDETQKNCKWSLQYFVQYLLWKYMPESVAAVCGKIMQRLFMRITYKV